MYIKTPTFHLLTLLPSVLFLMMPAAQAGTITGDTITCANPTLVFSCSAASATDGSGVEFTLTDSSSHSFTANFGATDLVLTNPATSGGFNASFGGGILLVFTDSTHPFTLATFLSSTNSFGAGNVSFSDGTLTLSVSGVTFLALDTVNIGLSTVSTATPEPTTAGLIGASMLLAAFRM